MEGSAFGNVHGPSGWAKAACIPVGLLRARPFQMPRVPGSSRLSASPDPRAAFTALSHPVPRGHEAASYAGHHPRPDQVLRDGGLPRAFAPGPVWTRKAVVGREAAQRWLPEGAHRVAGERTVHWACQAVVPEM